jgi:hypothetical protein
MKFENLAAMAAHFAMIDEAMKMALAGSIEEACVILERECKRVIGTYDYGWAPLADATKADRVAQGYPADEPLLRSGEMRD